jgi:serine/threonine protein kinase
LGVVHRDLKPDNILVDAKGHLYLADFGLSYALYRDQATVNDRVMEEDCGTPAYKAPEVFNASASRRYSAVADLWSLGITIMEMYTGHVRCHIITFPRAAGLYPAFTAILQQH